MYYPQIAIHLVTEVPLWDYVEHPQLIRLEGGGAALCLTRHYDERDDSLTWRIPFALAAFVSLFRPIVVYTTKDPERVVSGVDGKYPKVTYYRGDGGAELVRAENEEGEVHFATKPGQTLWDIRAVTSYSVRTANAWANVWGSVPVFTGKAWVFAQGHFKSDGTIESHHRTSFDGINRTDFRWIRDLYEKGKKLLENDPRFLAGDPSCNRVTEAA